MAEKIGTYCGQMRNLVIFSTHNKLYITFTTLKRTAPAQNRGFFAIYEFSESFVKLGNVLFYFYLVFYSKKMLQFITTNFICEIHTFFCTINCTLLFAPHFNLFCLSQRAPVWVPAHLLYSLKARSNFHNGRLESH